MWRPSRIKVWLVGLHKVPGDPPFLLPRRRRPAPPSGAINREWIFGLGGELGKPTTALERPGKPVVAAICQVAKTALAEVIERQPGDLLVVGFHAWQLRHEPPLVEGRVAGERELEVLARHRSAYPVLGARQPLRARQ